MDPWPSVFCSSPWLRVASAAEFFAARFISELMVVSAETPAMPTLPSSMVPSGGALKPLARAAFMPFHKRERASSFSWQPAVPFHSQGIARKCPRLKGSNLNMSLQCCRLSFEQLETSFSIGAVVICVLTFTFTRCAPTATQNPIEHAIVIRFASFTLGPSGRSHGRRPPRARGSA